MSKNLDRESKALYTPHPNSSKPINPLSLLPSTIKSVIKPINTSLGNRDILLSNLNPIPNSHPTSQKNKPINKKFQTNNSKASFNKSFKTKMCPDGRECRRQFTCKFAHNQKELRKPFLKRTKPCILYQRGKCSMGSACREYHGNMDLKKNYLYKSQPCKEWQQTGICHKGKLCIFKHGEGDLGLGSQQYLLANFVEIQQLEHVEVDYQLEKIDALKQDNEGQIQLELQEHKKQSQQNQQGIAGSNPKQVTKYQVTVQIAKNQEPEIEEGGLFMSF